MDVLVCLLFLLVAAIESQTIFAERPQETCEKNGMYNNRCKYDKAFKKYSLDLDRLFH